MSAPEVVAGPFGAFAVEVSALADQPGAVIRACEDRDMREVALMLAAARRVAALNYRMRGEGRG